MKMKIELTEKEVKEIIQEHLQSKFKSVGKVKIRVGTDWVGYGMDERQTTVFEGASWEVEM